MSFVAALLRMSKGVGSWVWLRMARRFCKREKQVLGCAKDDRKKSKDKGKSRSSASPRMTERKAKAGPRLRQG
jgi:hypothetical protein